MIYEHRFVQFNYPVLSLVSVSIEKICQCLTTFPSTLNSLLSTVLSTLFLVFGSVEKHCLSCMTYYVNDKYFDIKQRKTIIK